MKTELILENSKEIKKKELAISTNENVVILVQRITNKFIEGVVVHHFLPDKVGTVISNDSNYFERFKGTIKLTQ